MAIIKMTTAEHIQRLDEENVLIIQCLAKLCTSVARMQPYDDDPKSQMIQASVDEAFDVLNKILDKRIEKEDGTHG